METETYDVKESKDVLVLGFSLGKALKAAKEDDGKITYMDAGHLMSVFPKIGPALEGIDKVPAEIKDLDEAEAKELQDLISQEVGIIIAKEEMVEKINLGLQAMVALFKFVKAL